MHEFDVVWVEHPTIITKITKSQQPHKLRESTKEQGNRPKPKAWNEPWKIGRLNLNQKWEPWAAIGHTRFCRGTHVVRNRHPYFSILPAFPPVICPFPPCAYCIQSEVGLRFSPQRLQYEPRNCKHDFKLGISWSTSSPGAQVVGRFRVVDARGGSERKPSGEKMLNIPAKTLTLPVAKQGPPELTTPKHPRPVCWWQWRTLQRSRARGCSWKVLVPVCLKTFHFFVVLVCIFFALKIIHYACLKKNWKNKHGQGGVLRFISRNIMKHETIVFAPCGLVRLAF